MRTRWLLVVTGIAATILSGCGFGRRFANKSWGAGTYIPAAVCAVVGAGGGAYIQEVRRGENVFPCSTGTCTHRDDAEYWKGALIGAVAGAAVCGLAGHYLFDPDVATPTPPPPPPPPAMPEPTPIPVSRKIVLRGVHFDFNKSDIRIDSRPVLDEAANVLRENPNVRISVEGHTDAIGTAEYNEKLSVRRAEAVFRYLVNHGTRPDRMEVVGYGKTRPVADNETESGRAQNRRVELHVVNQPAREP